MLGASPCYWDWDTPNIYIYFISHVVVSYLLKTTICVQIMRSRCFPAVLDSCKE